MAISRAQTLAGLQIKGFSPAVVRSSEMIELFYRHLHAGTLDAYVRSVPPWWQPVLQPDTPQGWAALFRRHAPAPAAFACGSQPSLVEGGS